MKTFYSYNVNGIRAATEKGLMGWLDNCGGDFVCLQETKAQMGELDASFRERPGYKIWWTDAVKKGYSGVAIYAREEPQSVEKLGVAEYDDEGRFLALEYKDFWFAGGYFPNSQDAGARIDYKVGYLNAVQAWAAKKIAAGKNVVLCGDYNIAHKPIDLARPKQNEGNPGYLPEERAWMEQFINSGWVDTFRSLHPDKVEYSWWSYRFQAKAKNIGWRIDYHCVNEALRGKVKAAAIHPEVPFSDHVPVSTVLDL